MVLLQANANFMTRLNVKPYQVVQNITGNPIVASDIPLCQI